MSVQLYLGDCLDILPTMEAGSVDAVITDPPYGQTNEGYDRGTDGKLWRLLTHITRENASLVSFAGNPTYHRIASQIEGAGWQIRQMWAWVYRDGFMTSAWPAEGFDRLAPAFDPICYATRGKVLLSLEREGQTPWRRKRNGGKTNYSKRSGGHGRSKARGHWPRSIVASESIEGFQYFILSRTSPALRNEGKYHPNQKPLWLMEWLVSKLPVSATVLDPFMGSGTTGVACVQTGRNFIGIEIDPGYFEIAKQRIEAAQAEVVQLELGAQ